MTSKTCTTCKAVKPLGEYHGNGRGGLRAECKDCARSKAKAKGRDSAREAEARYRAKHRGELAERQAAWRKAHPERWRAINTKAVKAWRRAHPEQARELSRKVYLARRARERAGQ